MSDPALLALQNGALFYGQSVGAPGRAVGEAVFNTAMSGYQEILSDPSYHRQIVVFTAPHIGNVGMNADDMESDRIRVAGAALRDLSPTIGSWRGKETLGDALRAHGAVAIAGVDTRRLARLLRAEGAQNCCILTHAAGDEEAAARRALEAARAFPGLQGMDLAIEATTPQRCIWRAGSAPWREGLSDGEADGATRGAEADGRWRVAVYDFGVKRNILRLLADRGCELHLLPAATPVEEALALRPDGLFLSNGPGDPYACDYARRAVRCLLEARVPLFGICLGFQLLALAGGARTVKMKFGHHGANHPVQELDSGRVLITSQNHGFAVDEATLPASLRATHRSLFDGSLQGLECVDRPAFGFQGHPEASPGPHDIAPLFDRFIDLMRRCGKSSESVATDEHG